MNKTILSVAALLGFLTVAIGAFGAHGLEKLVAADDLATFETGVKYQMYHTLVLLFLGIVPVLTEKTKKTLFYLFLSGIILFSGSIYGLATNELSSFNFKSIGFVTPIGGTLLLIGWGIMFYKFIKLKTK
ncbi:DUF423 domain-containing protein [Leptobacterium flavescens]|uniref:DUF423 domain-containing protein n=1 Tax=Leptobacterium flavescens TaxID=472055 RepID=A0A6P0UUU7_9FLAO|nr:DUF423 domain-containing protein [Leptobacterium flavescens]NER14593.1 DUF423 domain-containing protein [Leptobacterium flavescens]